MQDVIQLLKLKSMRFLLRKPYGIAYFKIDRVFFSKIIRFDKESVKTENGLWTFEKDKIYVERDVVTEEKFKSEQTSQPTDAEVVEAVKAGKVKELIAKTKTEYKQAKFLGWRNGYPVIFLDQNDMRPLTFEKQLGDPVNPRNIQSVLNKEISAFEAELMRKQRDKLEKLLIVTMVLAACAAVIGYIALQDIGVVKEMVSKIPITTTGLN